MQPRPRFERVDQFGFLPLVQADLLEIPAPFFNHLTGVQNDHIQRPFDLQCQLQQRRFISIGAIKFPHSAHIAGRETSFLRIPFPQVLGGHDRRALFRAAANGLANLIAEFCLRHLLRHQIVQCFVKLRKICRLPLVHSRSFPALSAPILIQSRKGKHGEPAVFSFAVF